MEKKYFQVISHSDIHGIDTGETTFHFNQDGQIRHGHIIDEIGSGECVDAFEVDKGHKNGNEIHYVFDNGIIIVTNKKTGKVITELIARPAQIYRYWAGLNEPFPDEFQEIIRKAKIHVDKGCNFW